MGSFHPPGYLLGGADVRMHIVFQAVKEISNILATNMGMYWKPMMINH
jgi:hypothetical protein